MTAPDPGLTDLIAAHQWIAFAPRRNSKCACGWQGDDPDYPGVGHPAHVALAVEQHTIGRIAELEAEGKEKVIEAYDRGWNAAEHWWHDGAVEAEIPPHPYILRAALEGEQQ